MGKRKYKNSYDLPVWERPADYNGFSPDGDYLIYCRSRDDTLLSNTNFECVLATMGEAEATAMVGLPKPPKHSPPFVYTFTASHFAWGWVEYLMLRRCAPDELQQLVYEIHGTLSQYPVYNDSAYSEACHEAATAYWDRMCTDRRIELCGEVGISIFAARHSHIPERLYPEIEQQAIE